VSFTGGKTSPPSFEPILGRLEPSRGITIPWTVLAYFGAVRYTEKIPTLVGGYGSSVSFTVLPLSSKVDVSGIMTVVLSVVQARVQEKL